MADCVALGHASTRGGKSGLDRLGALRGDRRSPISCDRERRSRGTREQHRGRGSARARSIANYQADSRSDRANSILMPGLINTHAHAAMSLLRGIADDLTLTGLARTLYLSRGSEKRDAGVCRVGDEARVRGDAAIGHNHVHRYVLLRRCSGARRERGGHARRDGRDHHPVSRCRMRRHRLEALAHTEHFSVVRRATSGSQRRSLRMPFTPMTTPRCGPRELWPISYHAPIVIHVAETEKELNDTEAERHGTPVRSAGAIGRSWRRPTIAAHCVWLRARDFDILARHHVGVAHCPSSNMKLASGAAPVQAMLEHGDRRRAGHGRTGGQQQRFRSDGRDGSRGQASKAESRVIRARFPRGRSSRWRPSTARACSAREARLGSLEPGKRADMITLSLDEPNGVPLYDVTSQIVYALKA